MESGPRAADDAGAHAMSAAEIADAVAGTLLSGRPGDRATGFSIDSRTITRGEVFFAIAGERFDGHDFVAVAIDRGAFGLVVSRRPSEPDGWRGAFVILVQDTTTALQMLARHIRRASGARVVAVTGSAGKTTTKEITAALLGGRYRVFRNKGNLNNQIGLPLSLLELRARPEIAVMELGMNHAGEIRTLVTVAEPEVRVWTNVAEAHAEFFASIEAIADAKAEILEQAGSDTLLVANADDERVMKRARRFPGRVTTFGIESDAQIAARHIHSSGLTGTEATVRTPAGEIRLRSPLVGKANLSNLLAGIAVALEFDVPLTQIAQRAESLAPAPRRGEVLRLGDAVTVIDDSYNSNPAALARALEVVQQEVGRARGVAVLGEMLELGARSIELHEECGRRVAASGLSLLVTVGSAPARAMAEAAVAAGMPPEHVHHAASSAEAADYAAARVRRGDLVLVKGSRGIRTDQVVDRLRADFA